MSWIANKASLGKFSTQYALHYPNCFHLLHDQWHAPSYQLGNQGKSGEALCVLANIPPIALRMVEKHSAIHHLRDSGTLRRFTAHRTSTSLVTLLDILVGGLWWHVTTVCIRAWRHVRQENIWQCEQIVDALRSPTSADLLSLPLEERRYWNDPRPWLLFSLTLLVSPTAAGPYLSEVVMKFWISCYSFSVHNVRIILPD